MACCNPVVKVNSWERYSPIPAGLMHVAVMSPPTAPVALPMAMLRDVPSYKVCELRMASFTPWAKSPRGSRSRADNMVFIVRVIIKKDYLRLAKIVLFGLCRLF